MQRANAQTLATTGMRRTHPVCVATVAATRPSRRQETLLLGESTVVHHSILAHPTSATGQNPNLPHRNIDGRFTSISRHPAVECRGHDRTARMPLTLRPTALSRLADRVGARHLQSASHRIDLRALARAGRARCPPRYRL